MRVLIAPDKFKGSLSAREVADHIAIGIRDRLSNATVRTLPMADGGEGTAEVICDARGGEWITCAAHDALGRAIEARYVWLRESATAVMEMSAAAGMWRIAPEERNLLSANTYGVGEMMKHAAERGAKEILLGLGGSATNDGGLGMARASPGCGPSDSAGHTSRPYRPPTDCRRHPPIRPKDESRDHRSSRNRNPPT